MSQTQQDSLENLRQRATCPVCRTFYVKPKKLSNCSHVFCLNCVTCHLRANSHLNFPKCPMCRKPMLKRLSEIDTYEPARAEEDIANFVRQFEICDVCNKPENPNLKCPNCNWYICENCVPCHGKLKPSHVVETIISSDRKVKGQSNSLKTCTKHPGQVADLFCIICLRVLCVHCRDYSHDECIETYESSVVESVFTWRYFLQSYIQAQLELNCSTKGTELSINYTNKIKLLRIVQLKDIAKAAHNWLENIYEELKECIIFLREYKTQLNTVTCKINELEMPFKQIEFLQKRIDYAVAMGEDLYTQTERLLETPNDSDTVVYLLRNEERYPLLFQLKRKFQAEPELLMAEICSTTRGNVVRKQVLSGSIQELDSVFIGLLVSRIIPTKVNRFFNELCGVPLQNQNQNQNCYW